MNKILYIGQFSDGTTSRMRGEAIRELHQPETFQVIDTNVVFNTINRVYRTIGFKWKIGPLLKKINKLILEQTNNQNYDLIWVDKGIYLYKNTTKTLKGKTKRLVHYTPDTAFYGNKSHHFYDSINYYDFLITTKSFEQKNYEELVDKSKLYFLPQGFNKALHQPVTLFENKKHGVTFIGLNEPHREEIVSLLIKNQIPVYLAGKNWRSFINKNKSDYLHFLGEGLFSEKYVQTISSTYFSIGLLSKRFPELHTTRTFEIPACGTALITERNVEIDSFYEDNEVIKYSSLSEIIEKINYYSNHPEKLKTLIEKGNKKVLNGDFDYFNQMKKFFEEVYNHKTLEVQ